MPSFDNANHESFVQQIIESTPACVAIVSHDWEILFLNKQARPQSVNALPSSAEEDNNFWQLFPELAMTQYWDRLHQAMSERVSISFEQLYPPTGGYFQVRAYPLRVGLLISAQDITAQKEREGILKLSEYRFRTLVRALAQIVWTMSADGQEMLLSDQWCEFTGQSEKESSRMGALRAIHPDDQLQAIEEWRVAISTRTPYQGTQRVRRQDGQYRLMNIRAFSLTGNQGEILEWVGIAIDITEQHAAQAALAEANERFLLTTRATSDGIWDLNDETGEIYFSARWQEIHGLPSDDHYGHIDHWFHLVHPGDLERIKSFYAHLRRDPTSQRYTIEFRASHTDGGWRWISTRGMSIRNPQGVASRFIGSITDVTVQKTVDLLTGLKNRMFLLHELQERMPRSKTIVLLLLHIDSFTQINTILGRANSDSVVLEVARRLLRVSAPIGQAVLARTGGDEFGILIDNVEHEEDILGYAHELQRLLGEPVIYEDRELFLTVSIGVANSSGRYVDEDDFFHAAETAVNHSKANGRSQCTIFVPQMREKLADHIRLESSLRHAFEREQFVLHYQPKVDLRTGEFIGFEALLRWTHPDRGPISPALFIPIAEDNGLIREIGMWVLQQAAKQLSRWRIAKLVSPTATMAVNLSCKQFEDRNLVHNLLHTLDFDGLPLECLDLEITEGALIRDDKKALGLMQTLKSAGLHLHLDDFGTGYSSLSYLHRFPFDVLKIDQSFTRRIGERSDGIGVTRSIINLGRELDMKVIAEGVETEQQAAALVEMGCVFGQGYFFSRPLPAKDIEAALRQRTER